MNLRQNALMCMVQSCPKQIKASHSVQKEVSQASLGGCCTSVLAAGTRDDRRVVWRVTDSELPLALDARNMILFYVPKILE